MSQEATELSALFARVEVVFASGDLQRMAATLASIWRGLALVGAVPEFKGGRVRLAVRPLLLLCNVQRYNLFGAAWRWWAFVPEFKGGRACLAVRPLLLLRDLGHATQSVRHGPALVGAMPGLKR